MIELVNKSGQQAGHVAISTGAFRALLQVPSDDEYRIIVAHDFAPRELTNNVVIREIGFVGIEPAVLRSEEQIGGIIPFGEGVWQEIRPPARALGARLRLEGMPLGPASYAAESVRYRLAKGMRVGAAGTVHDGGIVFGLLNDRNQWAVKTAMGPGQFRSALEVPSDGEYRIVIGNDLPLGQRTNNAEVNEIGLVDPQPVWVGRPQDERRVGAITPLGEIAWQRILASGPAVGQRIASGWDATRACRLRRDIRAVSASQRDTGCSSRNSACRRDRSWIG